MSVKLLSGLGIIAHPFDVEGHSSQAAVQSTGYFNASSANIVVDHVASSPVGKLNIPSLKTTLFPNLRTNLIQPHVAVPFSTPSPQSNDTVPSPPRIAVTPQIEPQIMSEVSGPAPYETIFHDFDFEAIPYYNFWTEDELTNESEDRGDRKIEDIPRYIRLVWKAAPFIREFISADDQSIQHRTDSKGVKFGSQADNKKTVVYKGVQFSPEHLTNFELIRNSVANGHVSPGVINSVVELSHQQSGLGNEVLSTNKNHYIDEDAFLTHPDTVGLSIHEIKANIHTLTNGVVNAGKINNFPIASNMSDLKDGLYSGKFSIEKIQKDQGDFLSIRSIDPSIPPLSFETRIAVSSETEDATFDHVTDLVQKIAEHPLQIPKTTTQFVKVKFVDPTITGITHPSKVNFIGKPEHAENVAAISQFLPNLEVMQQSGIHAKPRDIKIPSFPSPPALPYLEYVGYVIEKYGRDQSGAWKLFETIDLPNSEFTEYIDAKVAYGAIYRYRIKAILRWTRHNSIDVSNNSKTFGSGQGSQTRSVSPYKSSYFQGEWNKGWSYAGVIDIVPPNAPDELTVRSDSQRKRIIITFKLPDNPQRDIYALRLFRKLVDKNGNDKTVWIQVGPVFGPQNVIYYDADVEFYQKHGLRYVYAAQCHTRHGEDSGLSEQLGARLNEQWSTFGEYPIDFFSQSGPKIEHHGAFSVYPYRTSPTIVVVPTEVSFAFSGREAHGNSSMANAQYYVQLESLDTGEKKNFKLNSTFNVQPTLIRNNAFSSQVPTFRTKPKTTSQIGNPRNGPVFGSRPQSGKDFEPSGLHMKAGKPSTSTGIK